MLTRESVEIEVHHADFGFGAHVLLSTFGIGGSNPKLIAVKSGPDGRTPLFEASFHKQYSTPLEFLTGSDLTGGREAYEWVVRQLMIHGYVALDDPGSYWFSFRAWRPAATPKWLSGEGARASLDRLCLDHPYHPHAWGIRAFHHLTQERPDLAKADAYRATRQFTHYAFGWWVYSEAVIDLQDVSERLGKKVDLRESALKAVDLAVRLDPNDSDYRSSRADLLSDLGRAADAQKDYEIIERQRKRSEQQQRR